MGCAPRIIPPLCPTVVAESCLKPDSAAALALIEKISLDVCEAQDNLLTAKINQSEFTNRHRANKNTLRHWGQSFIIYQTLAT